MFRLYFEVKDPSSQSYVFSSSHVWMWELDHKESWSLKNWCFWTVVLEKTLESPLDFKEIQPVNPKGNQSWKSLEGLMLKLTLQYFGHLMWRTYSLEKTLMLGEIQNRRRRGQQRMRWLDGEGDDRGWDGWMTSSTQWTWVWIFSGSWWMTGKPGVLQSIGLQRVRHNWVAKLNWNIQLFQQHLLNRLYFPFCIIFVLFLNFIQLYL